MLRGSADLFWAVLSGGLMALAFPRPDLFPFAWFGLVPLLLVMSRRPFVSGLTAGTVFFAGVLYWLNIVMTTYGGLQPIFSVIAYLMLVAYLACYWGGGCWLACLLQERRQLPVLLTLPLLWVALEYLRGLLLTGFPWALLGYSQQNFPWAIQSADVTGVYGVSWLLVAVNCALAWIIRQPRSFKARVGLALVVMASAGHLGYGVWKSSQPLEQRREQLSLALLQGNIDQAVKWDPAQRRSTVEHYLELSAKAAEEGAELAIWPEAATPFYFQEGAPLAKQIRRAAANLDLPLMIGSPSYEQQPDKDSVRYFNSAFLVSGSGELSGRSDKIHLVPFGEYVPFGRLLRFLDKLVVGVGDFSPGQVAPLELNGHRFGVLICYEAIFPRLARQYIRTGSDLLVNLTNDAWFGRSSAPYQQLAMARFRAIENRVWLARAANTGISALIAPSGRLVKTTPLFTTAMLSGQVGLGAQPTFYTRYGDLFAWFCLGVGGLFVLLLWGRYGSDRPRRQG